MKKLLLYTTIILLFSFSALAQTGSVSGKITDISGNPIESVNVSIQGPTLGSSTDAFGNYTINSIPLGQQTVLVSFVGYESIEKKIVVSSDRTNQVDFQMIESSENLNEVVVTGTRDQGYIVPMTDALKIPIQIVKAPVSISILSDELLEDLGARNLASVITYVPGLSNADNGGSNRENFIIRGFPQSQTYVNGIRQSITTEGIRAIETVERIEVVKGPSGVEASLTSPGGFVNILTKKPEDNFKAEAFLGGGDYNFFRIGGDVTGPLVEGKLNGRLIAAYQKKQFWRDGQDDRPVFTIAPSLSWNITPKTHMVAEYEFSWQNDPLDRGIIYLEDAGLENNFLPRNFSFHGDEDELKTKNHRIEVGLTHQFNDNLSLDLRYQRATQTANELAFRNADSEGGGVLFEDDGITFSGNSVMDIYFAEFGGDLTSNTLQLDFNGKFNTGSVKQKFNVGGSIAKNEDVFKDENGDFIYGDYVNEFDIFNPDNDQEPNKVGEQVYPNYERGDKINSIYAQLLTEWSTKFRTIASVRYDDVDVFARENIDGIGPEALAILQDNFAPDPITLYEDSYDDQLFSYRLGASYDFVLNLTGFVGFSSAGEPQPGVTRTGHNIEPIRANSFEGGIKWKLFGGKALATASLYYLERQNIAIEDPNNTPPEFFLAPLGSAEIKGFELEVVGKLTQDLSIFGGFSIQDSEITESDVDIVGNRFANVPGFQWSSFINYNGAGFGVKGLDLGVGLVYQGEREANSANEYQLPAYTRMDFALGYTFANKLQVRGNIFNLFDTTYYTSAQDSIFGSDQIAVGDRRLFQVTLTKRW